MLESLNLELLKIIHVSCVALSLGGFFLRGVWMLQNSMLLQKKIVKILPHIIDSTLLGSALLMLYIGHWSVLDNYWLMAKIVALMFYVVLGVYALKRGKTKTIRLFYWLVGMSVFFYIVSVALTKSVLGFLNFY